MASSHVTVPLPMRLGTHVIARMSGPALILGNVGISARTATPPETLRSLAGPPLLASTRVATFDVGLPGVYLLEVIAIYTEPYDPLVSNRTQCTARTMDPTFLGLIHVASGRVGWRGWGALHVAAPRYVFSRVQMCHRPPTIEPKPDPRHYFKFFTKVVTRITDVTAAPKEWGDRLGFDSYRWGATTIRDGGNASELAFVPLVGGGREVPRRDRLCMIGDSMAMMICQAIPGCRWTRTNHPADHRALGRWPAACDTFVVSMGQHDLGWPNGYPTPLTDFTRLLERLLAAHPAIYVLSMNPIPLSCIITSCPPMDWRTPPNVDAYNEAMARTVALRAPRSVFVSTLDIVGPAWDSASDWCHPRGLVQEAIAHRVAELPPLRGA